MNRINTLFQSKFKNILSIYFTAGHPALGSTVPVIEALSMAGADMIEIGIPFSDPMADGPVIQNSSGKALKNGMSLKLLFEQLKDIRTKTELPLLLMGYLNPVLQFGVERFCEHCAATGIDGIILPDLPLEVYLEQYRQVFQRYNLRKVFLIDYIRSPSVSKPTSCHLLFSNTRKVLKPVCFNITAASLNPASTSEG
ncbi:MAG: tryptophan synthase subunit alpha [Bacteroidetes bacterium]|nr:tryptophan synthase subunit alpha [Bacteroidota bacterium]